MLEIIFLLLPLPFPYPFPPTSSKALLQRSDPLKTSDMTKKLENFLSKCSDVVLVFLFGSFAGGKATAFSDLDIAIFFSATTDFYRINDLREKLSEMLNIEVDIVILNNASPIIKMQVLKKGTLLVNKDPKAYNEFFVNTVNEYDDLKQTRKEIEEKILRGRIYA